MERRGYSFKGATPWDVDNDYPADGSAYEIDEDYPVKEGATAQVHKGYCPAKGTAVAIKMVDLDKYEGKTDLDQLSQEASVMRKYRHRNILPLFCSFVHGQHLWLVMPWISGGTLAEIVQARFPDGMPEELIATIANEILQGLEYMHDDGSMHRDLKSGNLLVADSGHVLLADFGACAILEREAAAPGLATALEDPSSHASSPPLGGSLGDVGSLLRQSPSTRGGNMLQHVPEGSTSSASAAGTPLTGRSHCSNASNWSKYLSRNTFIGTPHYIAPEVMHVEVDGYTQSADIWAFGIIMLELATGQVPRHGMGFRALVMDTVHGDTPCLGSLNTKHTYSKAMHDFTARCLERNAGARPTPAQLLKHPFLERVRDISYLARALLGGALQQPMPSSKSFVLSSDGTQASPGGSPSSTASQPPKPDKTWWGRFRSFKHVRPALPQGLVPVWQITWVVYVSGRRYSICFQLDQEHRLARLLVNDFEIMRKSYNLVERYLWHTDNWCITLEEPQLKALQGKKLKINVRLGSGCIDGLAHLDNTVIENPACVSTRADMSPRLPVLQPLGSGGSSKKLAADLFPSASTGLKGSTSETSLPPVSPADKDVTTPQPQPGALPRSLSTPHYKAEQAASQPMQRTEEQLRHALQSIKV
ncbi:hypothetical protein CVIRNUC_008427 [Coccomyxa viridis]|uniref:Protein kinase domain-containing protein n=1 Tax=Coccomyxa viridis TaxID=1274662 RepID=A0AAV1ICY4_9CHLO|nr:hypothetical protein CVIRNUC_008427 [Coccomyxa viridis]